MNTRRNGIKKLSSQLIRVIEVVFCEYFDLFMLNATTWARIKCKRTILRAKSMRIVPSDPIHFHTALFGVSATIRTRKTPGEPTSGLDERKH